MACSVDSSDDNQFKFGEQPGTIGYGIIDWDGDDDDPRSFDTTSPNGYDLTDGGTNDGIQLLVYETDGQFVLKVEVYTGTTVATSTVQLVSAVPPPGQSYFIPFTDFNGAQSVLTGVGAIRFVISPTASNVDLTLDLFEATAETDWGDLPESPLGYPTSLASNGPRHVYSGTPAIWLGPVIDLEADGFPLSPSAVGDDNNNFDDEDGIERVRVEDGGAAWDDGGDTGHISATITGGSGDLYGWFDWNNDGAKDLLVGEFTGGYVNLFLNQGTDLNPVFNGYSKVESGGVPISVSYG